jgi:hypothetical protein
MRILFHFQFHFHNWGTKTSLTQPLFNVVPVPSLESERSYICMLRVSISPLYNVLLLNFGNVPTVRNHFHFIDNRPRPQVQARFGGLSLHYIHKHDARTFHLIFKSSAFST